MEYMRRTHRKQILELLKTLSEAHAEIKKRILSGDTPSVIGLLADCQEGAVQTGTFIEKLEGEGTKTVALLEEYCELLYKASLEAEYSDAADAGAAKRVKRLQMQLIAIENSAKNEFSQNNIEIAFIPYTASMWDALESVWLAAKDDPDCEAYVIPAPYYDRMPDGSFGQMHYEGDRYPDYVPVVDWREYDFAERRPDVIFTHNPYDDGNLVTSIHPDFYCKRLKELTELLIYVPYFVFIDGIPEHFAATAGCVYAHKVILQSDKMRDSYVSAFKRTFGNNLGNPKDRFIALGSPKYDAAINGRPEDFTMPENWNRLIAAADGAGKKVVLYNTSVGTILSGNEQYTKKLRSTLDMFRGRDDVTLWWRPHPLSEATYKSMRPQLFDEYRRIVAGYRREGFGIYDDTCDLHRAIANSDAYYGDWSSLITMYAITGKPVMIQNIHQLQYGEISMDAFLPDPDTLTAPGDCYLCEGAPPSLSLPGFLDCLVNGNNAAALTALDRRCMEITRSVNTHADGTAGRAIYVYVKETINRMTA
jgi:hypothetical protein